MKSQSLFFSILIDIALIAFGIVCICNPANTMLYISFVVGFCTIAAGISNIVKYFRMKDIVPSAQTLIWGIMQILLGIFFLSSRLFMAEFLSVVIAICVLFIGVSLIVKSFGIKALLFGFWWIFLLLGIAVSIIGVYGIRYPLVVGSAVFSCFIGIPMIVMGLVDIFASVGVKKINSSDESVDEQ